MLSSFYLQCILVIVLPLVLLSSVKCEQVPKGDRQAIPLAIVQADALAGAKHPPNADKLNSTCNGTVSGGNCNQTAQNTANVLRNSPNQNVVNLYTGQMDSSQPEAVQTDVSQPEVVWRLPDASEKAMDSFNEEPATNFSKCKQIASVDNADFDLEEFARCNHSQEILVGPLKSLPEHPNGNGPQDMKLKETGGYRRTTDLVDGRYSSSKPITRVKRMFDDDDDDDDGKKDLVVVLDRRSNVHIKNHPSKKRSSKRTDIGMPYIPMRDRYGFRTASRIPFDDSQIMNDEMSEIPSSQPVGMAAGPGYEPANYEPIQETERSMLFPGRDEETDAPSPFRLQDAFERSASWEPIENRHQFSEEQEYNFGLPDHNYDRSLESEANSMDNRLVNSFFGRGKATEELLNNPPEKADATNALFNSFGIGQNDIDRKFLTEARNIRDYLTGNEGIGPRSLGHDSRQQNNIQLDTSPELVGEHPNAWNMIDSASYTPYSQEAGSLMSTNHPDYSQILQSQKSLGRVFVPLNLDAMSRDVQREVASNYATPKPRVPSRLVETDKSLSNYPTIMKSFYPNVPYQTVTGASLHPPDMNAPAFRSFIQQGYPQPMPVPLQPVPMAMPFSGFIPNSNTQMQYALGNPPQMFNGPAPMQMPGLPFPVPLQSGFSGASGNNIFPKQAVKERKQKKKTKEPGMLTVSSSENDDDTAKLKTANSDFEELIPKNQHNTVLRVNVQSKPKNDSVKFLREKFANDLTSLRSAIKEVLDNSMLAGNITSEQAKAITEQLTGALSIKNKTSNATTANMTAPINTMEEKLKSMRNSVAKASNGCADTIDGCKRFKDAGICPFVSAFMNGACAKTCKTCASHSKTGIETELGTRPEANIDFGDANGPVMYLNFDDVTNNNVVVDKSKHKNNAALLNGARISGRKLGTCGKGAEVNGGDISWEGKSFADKPVDAVTLAMWVKVHKGGIINWFASGDQGTTFSTSTEEAIIPSKIWTHVAGTYDAATGLSRVYINGALVKQTQQPKGQKLVQDWLANGVGKSFGDDSMHYVDEIYIFNRALQEAEVKAIYDKCSFNRMVIHYGFQKGNNSIINDQSGLENDAILVGGAVQKENCDRCGTCMDMSHGLNPTVKIERISLSHIPTRAVSIAVWVSMNTTKGIHDVFITQGPLDGSGYRLRIIDGKVRWSAGTDNGETIFDKETSTVVIPETLWTHIIVTYSKETGDVSIFVNGVSKLHETVESGQRKLLPKDWETEAKLGGESFNGYMDEFIMYNWAIDASEATYVRNYCADHPKLVRFTVRVPLTKRNKIQRRYEKSSARIGKKLIDILRNV